MTSDFAKRPAIVRVAAPAALAALVSLALGACGAHVSEHTVRPLAMTGSVAAALERIQPLDTGESRLLYLYERGSILHESGDFAASNEAFDRAEILLDDLYTKSLSRALGSLFTGDYLLQYRGERFEAALVHYYRIMNYLNLGQVSEAAVECRRLNQRLQLYGDAGGSFYRDDPFLQYLTGMVYGLARERVDADVSFRVALDGYRDLGPKYGVATPDRLLCDLAENSRALGNRDDAARYREQGGCPPRAQGPRAGVLRLFLECGAIPIKHENSIAAPIYKNEIHDDLDEAGYARELSHRCRQPVIADREVEYLLKISLPEMAPTRGAIEFARIRAIPAIEGSSVARGDDPAADVEAVTGTNLGTLALASFEEHQGEILTRAVARSLAKYLATRAAEGDDEKDGKKEKKHDRWMGRLVNLFGVATEAADTRCWSSLPEKILMSSLDLPPGRYRIEVELLGDARQRVGFISLEDVQITSGRSTIVSRRVS
jgi:hypothetical protein